MCGRFALQSTAEEIGDYFNIEPPLIFSSRFNIAPTTPVLAKTEASLSLFSWGLVPGWAKDVNIGHKMFNARAETVAEKPSFRSAYKRRRCLVPSTGYYEWRLEDGAKQPYFFHLGHRLFAFGGIWEHWQDAMGNELQTCSILTVDAAPEIKWVHPRMPVVIREEDHANWLDHANEQTTEAHSCIERADREFMIYPVAKLVNSARNDSANLIQPLETG